MEVNDLLIEKLATLSRLRFDEQEQVEIRADLQQMISFIEKLQEVDTRGVEPLLFMSGNTNALREDVVAGSVERAAGLQNAPDSDGIFFKVPKVIKK